jgi:exodeoxyribonuclease VIII
MPHPRKYPCFVTQTEDEYHSDHSAYGKSMLWRFFKRRAAFKAEFLDHSRPPAPETGEMKIGSLAHAGLLQPDRFEQLYAIYPPEVLGSNGRLGTTASAQFEARAASQGRRAVKPAEFELIRRLVESVSAKLHGWLELESHRERSIYWLNTQTGLLCRCRPDWIIISGGVAHVFDLKTTGDSSPEAFSYKVEDFGYWLQDRHYSEGVAAVLKMPVRFYFVVVETEFPHITAIHKIDSAQLAQCDAARLQILRNLKDCLSTGDYSESWENRISTIAIRKRVFDSLTSTERKTY